MNFKPAQCSSCGGSLQVPDDRTTVNCMYCGATIVVREAIQSAAAATVPNLLRLAQTALTSLNYQEAYEYFTRVLEIDSNNTHAWAGKAEAAGKLSSQHTFRMQEMLNYFGNALASASETQLSHVTENAAGVICAVVSDDYLRMRSALSSSFLENATWAFYLNRVGELLMALEDANRLIPTNVKVVRTIIWLCDQNTDRVYFNNAQGKQVSRAFDAGWNTSITQKRSRYLEELYRVDPSLRPAPLVIANKTEGDFINLKWATIGFGALIFFAVLLMIAVVVMSPTTTNRSASDGPTASLTPTPTIPSAVNPSENQVSSSTTSNFATALVCSLPGQVFPNTPFASLGGGQWGKWIDSGGELDYACQGGTDLIKLKKDGNVDITAEYTVLGNSRSAHYISAEYTAFQYTGQTADERRLRQQYADFCERLASKLYGKTLSKAFRNRLLNEATYSPTGTVNSHAENIGAGYVSLSSNKNNAMVLLNVRFFPSEADYRTYKDS